MDASWVYVADWLRPWWDFFAKISVALYWPAWSAIFSAGALSATIWLANSNARHRRRGEATTIEAAAFLADIAFEGLRSALEAVGSSDWPTERGRLTSYLTMLKLVDRMRDFDLTKLPSPESLKNFLQAQAVIVTISEMADGKQIDNSIARAQGLLASGESYVRELLKEARSLGGKGSGNAYFEHVSKD